MYTYLCVLLWRDSTHAAGYLRVFSNILEDIWTSIHDHKSLWTSDTHVRYRHCVEIQNIYDVLMSFSFFFCFKAALIWYKRIVLIFMYTCWKEEWYTHTACMCIQSGHHLSSTLAKSGSRVWSLDFGFPSSSGRLALLWPVSSMGASQGPGSWSLDWGKIVRTGHKMASYISFSRCSAAGKNPRLFYSR